MSTELTKLDPITIAHVAGQPERPAHVVGAVAGRPKQREVGGWRLDTSGFAETNAARWETEAERAGVAQIAVDAVIDKQHSAAPLLHLNHHRSAAGDEGAARLGPEPNVFWQILGGSRNRGDIGAERRWRHIRVADREPASDVDDIHRNAACRDQLGGQCDGPRIGIRIETLRPTWKAIPRQAACGRAARRSLAASSGGAPNLPERS